MSRIQMIQEHIDITRNQIIEQLQDEVAQFQQKMNLMDESSNGKNERWGRTVFQEIISRKRTLIQRLSQMPN